MELTISGISQKNGEKVAYVRFTEGENYAEGIIPECIITSQKGYSKEEISQLEYYLKANLLELKKQAAQINPLKNMLDI